MEKFVEPIEKFTKANAYEFLKKLGEVVTFATEEDQKLFYSEIKENFEPQAGGGASKNPSYKDNDELSETFGQMMHYCRFKQCYMPESTMNMHGGKSKGASTIAALHDYRIGKEVKKLKDESLDLFKAGDYANGAEKATKADELEETRSKASTFDDENMQYIVDELAEKEAAKNAGTNEASEEAVENDEQGAQ